MGRVGKGGMVYGRIGDRFSFLFSLDSSSLGRVG